jgi:hypothetical protein
MVRRNRMDDLKDDLNKDIPGKSFKPGTDKFDTIKKPEPDDLNKDIPGKSFKPGTGKFDTIKKPGDSVSGIFIGARSQTIEDTRTHRPKELFVIKLREENEAAVVRKVPCAAMMLQAWDDIVDEYGNGDEAIAISNLRGHRMKIKRLPDSETKGGNQLGQYEIIVSEIPAG